MRNKNNPTPRPVAARASGGNGHTIFYLTNIRSIQQQRNKYYVNLGVSEFIKEQKKSLRGKRFQLREEPPLFCGANKIAIIEAKGRDVIKARFTHIGCNSWTCPNCSIKKALKVKYLLRDVIRLNELGYFLTLTLDPKIVPQQYLSEELNFTHKYITKLFNHFITVLKRSFLRDRGVQLKYIWVIEFQKNGNAHLHILFNIFLPIEEIQKIWVRVGGGHIMWIEKVKSLEGISNYVSDYIVKGIKGDLERPSGFRYFERRYSISKSCKRPTYDAKPLFRNFSLVEFYTSLEALGWTWVYNALYRL